jgi:hypothetical protein
MQLKQFFLVLVLTACSFQADSAMEEGRAFDFMTDESSLMEKVDNLPEDKPMDVDGTAYEAQATSSFDKLKPTTLDNNPLRNDEDFVRNSIPELKQRDFDIDRFLEEFDRIDCSKNNGDESDPLNVLCEHKLMNTAFSPLGDFNSDHNAFYNYLKDQIYQPLAYDVRKRQSISDMLIDTMNMSNKTSIFEGKPLMTNYNKFEETIVKFFEDIAGKSSDMEANKDAINENIISILKRFHLYWNFLRYKGQFEKLKVDTKEVMRTLLKSYMMKRDFLNYISKTLIKGIIKAYYRFIRAHKMIEVLNKYGPQLIINQIVKRYKTVGERIKNSNFSQILTVKEISYLISLVQVYHILSYKQGLQDSTIINNFSTAIVRRIQTEYDFFEQYLTDEPLDKLRLKQIRDFTAVLLLKFKHMTFIMFNYHGISQYANLPQMNYIKSPFAIKIYYEVLDNLLMIPKTCANFLLLKNCVVHETTKVLKYITNKYMVKRSTYGWYYLQELTSMMRSMYSMSDQSVWDNWDLFKNYFYQNLFSVMYTYKKMFQVSDMDVVENLESLIGNKIDEMKAEASPMTDPLEFGVLDQLDKSVYNEFLQIKADYNNYAPIERDPTIRSYIKNRLNKFFILFLKENKSHVSTPVKELIKKIKASIDVWVVEVARSLEKSFNIGPAAVVPIVQNLSVKDPAERLKLEKPSYGNSMPEIKDIFDEKKSPKTTQKSAELRDLKGNQTATEAKKDPRAEVLSAPIESATSPLAESKVATTDLK